MNYKHINKKILFGSALALAFATMSNHQVQAAGQNSQTETKPNILIIVADDLGNADVGYHNLSSEIPTPNIDALASSGVQFSCGYSTAPVCGPSRAGLLTGIYQQRFGFVDNSGPFRQTPETVPGIPTTVNNIAEYFKPLGYATATIGKWHVGGEAGEDELFPTRRGFDEFFGFMGGAADYFPEDNLKKTLFRNETPVDYESQYLTDALGREAMDFIQRHKDEPFCLYLPYNAVHGPLQAPDSLIQKFSHVTNASRRKLCAMQYAMDKSIGQVLAKLEELNLSSNTLVFFISDNGGKIAGNYSYNTPYHGEKNTVYEGGIRLPFCIKWPGHVPEGVVYDKPVIALDIVPTALKAAGETIDEEYFDGVDLLPYVNGQQTTAPHEFLFWRNNAIWAVRDGDWKLTKNKDSDRPKLFKISEDVSEQVDLHDQHPEEVARLQQKYDEWQASTMEPQWGWQPGICGDYVAHPEENFEHIVKKPFLTMGSGITAEVAENPNKSGINTSNTALKIVRTGESAPNWGGVWATIPQFQRKFRYVHMKVLKQRASVVRFKLEGPNKYGKVVTSLNAQTAVNEWQDMVFDFDAYVGAVNKLNIQPDFEQGPLHTIYIDDIEFSDDPTPRTETSTGTNDKVLQGLKLYPNPVKNKLYLSGIHDHNGLIEIFNTAGNRVSSFLTDNVGEGMDISDLETGVYILKLIADNRPLVSTFLKL